MFGQVKAHIGLLSLPYLLLELMCVTKVFLEYKKVQYQKMYPVYLKDLFKMFFLRI